MLRFLFSNCVTTDYHKATCEADGVQMTQGSISYANGLELRMSQVVIVVPKGSVYSVDHKVGPWKMAFCRGPIFFLNKNQSRKSLGPSLGVNRMWTKRNNDHAPKSECLCFIIYA